MFTLNRKHVLKTPRFVEAAPTSFSEPRHGSRSETRASTRTPSGSLSALCFHRSPDRDCPPGFDGTGDGHGTCSVQSRGPRAPPGADGKKVRREGAHACVSHSGLPRGSREACGPTSVPTRHSVSALVPAKPRVPEFLGNRHRRPCVFADRPGQAFSTQRGAGSPWGAPAPTCPRGGTTARARWLLVVTSLTTNQAYSRARRCTSTLIVQHLLVRPCTPARPTLAPAPRLRCRLRRRARVCGWAWAPALSPVGSMCLHAS